tara:strand:- start:281 stop:385 length:105 start_codon:yes stop_codon:yes gene_type:complete
LVVDVVVDIRKIAILTGRVVLADQVVVLEEVPMD